MSLLRLDMRGAVVAAVVLLVASLALRPARHRWLRFAAAACLETGLVCALFALWQLANRVTHTHVAGGLSHGRSLWHLERWLHVPSETSLQRLVLPHPDVVQALNWYYAFAHLTGMAIFLVWLWLRHREDYPRWRNTMVLFTGIALVVETVPVAPPRLIGGTGLVDTAAAYGQSVYTVLGSGVADQYAALPSIHVGWAVLIGVAVWRSGRGPWRVIGPLHAVMTVVVVVATANHYWFDGLTAVGVLALAVGLREALRVAVVKLGHGRSTGHTDVEQRQPVMTG